MTLPLEWAPLAQEDFDEIDSRDETLADRIVGLTEGIAINPELGRIAPEFEDPLLRDVLVAVKGKRGARYRIVYRIEGSVVRVLRIWPTASMLAYRNLG